MPVGTVASGLGSLLNSMLASVAQAEGTGFEPVVPNGHSSFQDWCIQPDSANPPGDGHRLSAG